MVGFAHLPRRCTTDLLLRFGLATATGLAGGKLCQWLRVPRVVGYIVVGVLLGGSFVDLIPLQQVADLAPFTDFALALIGFLIGGELDRGVFHRYGRQMVVIMLVDGLAAAIAVAGLLWLWTGDLPLALLLGSLASATAPAATVDALARAVADPRRDGARHGADQPRAPAQPQGVRGGAGDHAADPCAVLRAGAGRGVAAILRASKNKELEMSSASGLARRSSSVVAFAVCATALCGQRSWVQRPTEHAPSVRWNAGMCFDSWRGRMVLFGGRDVTAPGTVLHDTWENDGSDWVLRQPATVPTGLDIFGLAFDSARGVTVLATWAGGIWEYDGVDWSLRSTGPGFTRPDRIAYDALRQRTVVFGRGVSGTQPAITYEWDGISLQAFSTTTGPRDTGELTGMTFDGQQCALYLPFLGFPTFDGGQLWRWNGAAWSSAPATGPSYVSGARLCAAGPLGTVLYGGTANQSAVIGTYALSGGFQTVATNGTPGGRGGHTMAYDSLRERLVLFGGSWYAAGGSLSITVGLRDTWELTVPPIVADATAFGPGCGAPALTLLPQAGSRPTIGGTFVSEVQNSAPGATAIAWSFSNQMLMAVPVLPIDAAPWGIPGCLLHVWPDVLGDACTPVGGGVSQFVWSVPSVSALVGVQVYQQAYSFRAGAGPMQVVLSNGLQLTIGDV